MIELILKLGWLILWSLFTVSILTHDILEVRHNTRYSSIQLSTLILELLCEALNMWSLADLRNIGLLGAACLFIAGASWVVSCLDELSDLLFLLVQLLHHLAACHLWSLS